MTGCHTPQAWALTHVSPGNKDKFNDSLCDSAARPRIPPRRPCIFRRPLPALYHVPCTMSARLYCSLARRSFSVVLSRPVF